jgi:hypothetical protein
MIQGLHHGPNPTSTVAKLNSTTGAVTLVMESMPFLDGIAFDKAGNMYLGEYDKNAIVKVPVETRKPVYFARLRFASKLAVSPDGKKIYAVTDPPMESGQPPAIWVRDLERGPISLFAKNLPYLSDIAFSPSE